MAASQTSPWLTVSQLARVLSVPPSWIYARTYRGARDPLPYKRLGRWLRFDIDEIHAWVEERTQREKDEKAAAAGAWSMPERPPAKPVVKGAPPLPFRAAPKTRGPKK